MVAHRVNAYHVITLVNIIAVINYCGSNVILWRFMAKLHWQEIVAMDLTSTDDPN